MPLIGDKPCWASLGGLSHDRENACGIANRTDKADMILGK